MATNKALLQEIEELNTMVDAHGARILKLERTVVDEVVRVEAVRDEFQRTRTRLTRVVEEVRDRVVGILADTTMLIKEVTDAVQNPVPESTPEEEPFEKDSEENPEEEVLPDSPIEY